MNGYGARTQNYQEYLKDHNYYEKHKHLKGKTLKDKAEIINKKNKNEFQILQEERITKILNDLNNKLKNIKTFKELRQLEDEAYNIGEGIILRRKYSMNTKYKYKTVGLYAYGFDDIGNNEVTFLLSDGVSYRKMKIENLHKYYAYNNH